LLSTGARVAVPGHFVPMAGFFSLREEDRSLGEGLTLYPIKITIPVATTATFQFRIVPTPTTQPFTGSANIVDSTGSTLATTSFSFTGPLLTVNVNMTAGIHQNLGFVVKSTQDLTDQTISFSVICPNTVDYASQIYGLTYDMATLMGHQSVADDYQASSTSSSTGLWTLLQNLTAELYKQGRIGHCQMPSHTERFFPTDPISALKYMSNMQSLSQPVLPLATGGQRTYLFEDIDDLMFKNWKSLDIYSETNPLPTIVYAWDKGVSDGVDVLQLNLQFRLNIEYITTSPVAPAFNPPPFLYSLFHAVTQAMSESQSGEDMGGENPKHLERMKRIARSVASNPTVQRLAKEAGRSFLTYACEAAPLLLL